MNNAEILDLAGRIERKMADIYRFFAECFSHDENYSSLWKGMAEEEDAHAGFLDAKFRMVMLSPQSFGLSIMDKEDIEETYDRLVEMEKTIRKGPLRIQDAVRMALQMELELVEKSYNKLVDTGDPVIRRIFDELTRGDHHLEKLAATAARLGVKIRYAN